MFASLLASFGVTRDSNKLWFSGQLLAVAGVIASGSVDIVGLGHWLGVPISLVAAHWLTAVSVTVLFFCGKYGNSPLPGASKQPPQP